MEACTELERLAPPPQAQHWGSQVPTQEELAALGRDAGSSKTVAALMHGREQLRGRLEGMLESGAMGEVRKRGARVVGKLLGEAGQEGLLMHKVSEPRRKKLLYGVWESTRPGSSSPSVGESAGAVCMCLCMCQGTWFGVGGGRRLSM